MLFDDLLWYVPKEALNLENLDAEGFWSPEKAVPKHPIMHMPVMANLILFILMLLIVWITFYI
jgi:hypothetical protein